MSGFTRRFTSFPDAATIQAIEGVVIVDEAPSGGVQGADSGTVFFVGEYEDGGFATDPTKPVDVFHPAGGPIFVGRDQFNSLVGGLGYTVNGVKTQYPCCRISNGELWNGNAYVQASRLAFRRFYAIRVDTSIGQVMFSALAFIESAGPGPWALATGQTLVFFTDGSTTSHTATFTGVAATLTGSGASYATITPGEYIDISADGGGTVRTTFQAGDTTEAAVLARINTAFGYTIAADSSGQVKLTSQIAGTLSSLLVVGGSSGTLAKVGFTGGATSSGSGNVPNISAVTINDVAAVVSSISQIVLRRPDSGKIRIASVTGGNGYIALSSASTATAFGFPTATAASITGSGGTFTMSGSDTLIVAIDGGAPVTITFAGSETTIANVVSTINTALGATNAVNSSGQLELLSLNRGTKSSVKITGGNAVAKLGLPAAGSGAAFVVGVGGVSASTGSRATTIPAGTVLSHGGAASSRVVTMQTLQIPALTTSAVSVKVRPAQDDGSYAGLSASQIDTIETNPTPYAEFGVSNPGALSVALTDPQKDAAYQAAIDRTKALSGPSRKCNYIVSARQSETCRLATRQNALDTSAVGHFGRKTFVQGPIGMGLPAMVAPGAPGVAAYRNERLIYTAGWRKVMPEIAALGSTLGGLGFTDTGEVLVHGDIVLASLCSLLNPEENPAQATDLIPSLYVGVEPALEKLTVDDYALAKSNGICLPIFDENEGPQYMSGVTSVDPNASPSQVPIARVKLADFCTDSVAEFDAKYIKKLGTKKRKAMLIAKTTEFLGDLESQERISASQVSEGTPPGRRMFVINWRVEPLDSLDNVVNNTVIGEGAIAQTTRVGQ